MILPLLVVKKPVLLVLDNQYIELTSRELCLKYKICGGDFYLSSGVRPFF